MTIVGVDFKHRVVLIGHVQWFGWKARAQALIEVCLRDADNVCLIDRQKASVEGVHESRLVNTKRDNETRDVTRRSSKICDTG